MEYSEKDKKSPWYKEGLAFECTGCGKCCTGAPGYVWVSDSEIESIAKRLALSKEEFLKQYTWKVDGKISLIEKPEADEGRMNDCIFLKGNACTIYEDRPTQCRTFPWWPDILKSERSWKEAAKKCEGVGRGEKLISFEEIENGLKKQIEAENPDL